MTSQPEPVTPRRSGPGLLFFALLVVGLAIFAARNLVKLTRTEPTPERVDACLRMRDSAARCPEQFVTAMLELQAAQMSEMEEKLAEPGAREQMLKVGVEQIARDAAEPPERRRASCEDTVERAPAPKPEEIAALDACWAELDCERMVACMKPVLEQQMQAQK